MSTYLHDLLDYVFLSCNGHVKSNSALCNYLNVKEFFAQKGRDIWKLIDFIATWNHNH